VIDDDLIDHVVVLFAYLHSTLSPSWFDHEPVCK
jgi:hypothetical protein